LERLTDDVGFIPNLNINAEHLPCLVSGIRYAYARLGLHAQADSCVHIARVSFALFFQK